MSQEKAAAMPMIRSTIAVVRTAPSRGVDEGFRQRDLPVDEAR